MIRCRLAVLAVVVMSALAKGGIFPPASEDAHIPELVDKATFVCKGGVTSAPEVRNIMGPLPRMTGIAIVRIDRCFKGTLEGSVRIAVDQYRPSAGWGGGGHIFTPQAGQYLLFFLRRNGESYEIADEGHGALPVSRLTAIPPVAGDPLLQLELDFKAGLNDSDPEMVLKSICWLGHLRHLHSTAELKGLLGESDPIQRAYLWEALLMADDLSILPDVANYLDQQGPLPDHFYLPRDRLYLMQSRLLLAICGVRDRAALPYLEHFAESPDPLVRVRALEALRQIGSLKSAPVFLRALDDHQNDIDFVAMQSLLELAGGGAVDWVPTWDDFKKAPAAYAAACRDWWESEGEARARARAVSKMVRTPQNQ